MLRFEEYVKVASQAIAAIQYPKAPAALYEPIAYTMALGGKRLRPVLALMACDAFCGDYSRAINQAVGIELYHNFTLLHDDVMDKADVRRGKPTVHVRWNDNVAILSGDAMLTMAGQRVAEADSAHIKAAMELFNRTAMEVYEGQQYDMDFENRNDVTEEEYIAMIRLKTSVLLGCACKMGAIMADADAKDADRIYQYGVDLGVAFQLQDDWLDVYGDPATFGKEIGGDIMNNKKTFMLINAMNRATGADREELTHWLAAENPAREEKVAAVTAIYTRLGISELATEAMNRYNDRALQVLDSINISEEARQQFRDFANMLMHRNR
ncbi:MAG: polyprenyl synthetase family protein [Bacteroidales bacterium]|nr:polyprenyl synthetase family protein [Bacteroidales bacterium]